MKKRKKLQAADNVSGPSRDGGNRRWEDLGSDLLVAIFSRVGIEDRIAGLPYVCSSWRCAVRDPFCWRVLDFRSWDTISDRLGCRGPEAIDFFCLFDFAISRSAGLVDCVYFPYFSDDSILTFLADRCPMLQYFSLEKSNASKSVLCRNIRKLKFLKGMAVHENLICRHVLQHVNQCCSNFIELEVFSDTMDKQMASNICECLPHLQKLEITGSRLFIALLDRLKELEFLDVSGYGGITNEAIEKASHLKVFPWDSKYRKYGLDVFESCLFDCVLDQQLTEW